MKREKLGSTKMLEKKRKTKRKKVSTLSVMPQLEEKEEKKKKRKEKIRSHQDKSRSLAWKSDMIMT